MRLSKIYTRTGDKGSTRLADGTEIPKCHDRIEAYGTVDELNSVAGMFRDSLENVSQLGDLRSKVLKIQNDLFDIGGELATPKEWLDKLSSLVSTDSIARLESEIDKVNENLPPLKNFVLPGGHKSNSLAHLCRTTCRRAERRVLKLSEKDDVRPEVIAYLNRLSDWFFVAGRSVSKALNIEEVLWDQKQKK